MKGAYPSTWIAKTSSIRKRESTRKATVDDQPTSHSPLPATAYTTPRTAPKPPSIASSFRSVFLKASVIKTPSFSSLRSSNSIVSTSYNLNHPYSAMVPAPLPVVSSQEKGDDDDDCPVCLEPLSFSFRLPGEKPHVLPECGHALHEACFTAVYGPPPGQLKTSVIRKSNLGVCGVCRRPMKVGDSDGGKSNKLAALTGMGERHQQTLYPGRDASGSVRSYSRSQATPTRPYDPTEDDPIDHATSVKSGGSEPQSHYVVAPSIQVRSEFASIVRNSDSSQPLTCIVIVELPGKRILGPTPGLLLLDTYPAQSRSASTRQSPHTAFHSPPPESSSSSNTYHEGNSTLQGTSPVTTISPNRHALIDPYSSPPASEEDSPFHAITEDLRNRIIDWKGHPLSGLGPLQMYDLLSVRRDAIVREFFVYLFKEAIICVVEEKKRGLGRLLSNAGVGDGGQANVGNQGQTKGVLRLKGRIYIRHIKNVTDTSVSHEMSLTIDMEDERLDSFILIFRERSSLETWKNQIQNLVTVFQRQSVLSSPTRQPTPMEGAGLEEFGGSRKAAKMLSGSTGTASTYDSLLQSSSRSTMSSNTSHGSAHLGIGGTLRSHQTKLATLEESDESIRYNTPAPSISLVTPHTSSGPSNSLPPLPHPPMDIILVISVPPPHATPSTATLKNRVIKTSLDFVIASLGVKDRLSIVTFEVGPGGKVRKTPFLNVGRAQSRARLAKFVDGIGTKGGDDNPLEDEFLVRGSLEEKSDVVTAVNHSLDVVLQRKARNPISGMILVSDAADTTRRAQMDLVLARAEAASIPIHSFGYGRSHDPASLWLISNHTSGTYTFVKDWYELRGCIAGCVGGMMSIGLKDMKLHMKIVDGNRFRIRKVSGGPASILHSDGRDVDVEVGELRYGERKEMLIELELDNTDIALAKRQRGGHSRAMNATDQFNQRMGFNGYAIDDDPDLVEGMMDGMIDEVPVFEVDGSFYDPATSKHVSRLAHPVLLTVTLLPTTGNRPRSPPVPGSDPVIVRRRMELLASDMITRALVLISRKNYSQAQKILTETRRILHTVLQNVTQSLPLPPNNGGTIGRNRKEILQLAAVRALQAVMTDMQTLLEALEDNPDAFAHDQRNFGAQQSMVLRDQKSWIGRSAIEKLFWTIDNSIELVSRSTDWVGRD